MHTDQLFEITSIDEMDLIENLTRDFSLQIKNYHLLFGMEIDELKQDFAEECIIALKTLSLSKKGISESLLKRKIENGFAKKIAYSIQIPTKDLMRFMALRSMSLEKELFSPEDSLFYERVHNTILSRRNKPYESVFKPSMRYSMCLNFES